MTVAAALATAWPTLSTSDHALLRILLRKIQLRRPVQQRYDLEWRADATAPAIAPRDLTALAALCFACALEPPPAGDTVGFALHCVNAGFVALERSAPGEGNPDAREVTALGESVLAAVLKNLP